jgi:hypothetical protein
MQTEWTQPDAVPDDCIQAIASILKEADSIEISEDGYQIRRKNVRAPAPLSLPLCTYIKT